jgi:hypothetical protein
MKNQIIVIVKSYDAKFAYTLIRYSLWNQNMKAPPNTKEKNHQQDNTIAKR